jgi:hypothetical protein
MAEVEAQRRIRGFPSHKELVKIATTLAIGRPIDDGTLQVIVKQSLRLWGECLERRNHEIEFISLRAKARAQDLEKQNQIPKPKNYPVTADDFLKLLIGGKYKSRRMKIYRDYAKEMIWLSHINWLVHPRNPSDKISYEEAEKVAEPASPDEVDNWMNEFKQRKYHNEDAYTFPARIFLEWLAKQPSERASKAAKQRWAKSKKTGNVGQYDQYSDLSNEERLEKQI